MKLFKKKPPRLFEMFLSLISKPEERFSVVGDFEEIYAKIASEQNIFKAFIWYGSQVVKSIPLFFMSTIYWSWTMFINYLKIAIRNMQKHRVFSIINITGLALGMGCFLLMILYVKYEFSFDRFHGRFNNLYRVIRHYKGDQGQPESFVGGTPAPLAPKMMEEFVEVLNGSRIGEVEGTIWRGKQGFHEIGLFADSHFLEMFDFEWIQGNRKTALKAPYTIVLTEELADKYFGDEDPIGKTLTFSKAININRGSENERYDVQITGIIDKVPLNGHLQFDYLLSFETIASAGGNPKILEMWGRSHYYNYVELRPEAQYQDLHSRLAEYSPRFRGTDPGRYILQPLRDIHWDARTMDELPGNVRNSRTYLYIFSTIAGFVLIIGCINYMNLATARFAQRMREIGLRKVVGAQRSQLMQQFFGESLFVSVFSSIAALVFLCLLLPAFNHLVDREISLSTLKDPVFILGGFCVIFITGLVSGSYPAVFLTSLQPVGILKTTGFKRKKGIGFRNGLVALQFAVSIGLIACTLIVTRQIQFIRNKDIGYDREHVVVIPLRDEQARQRSEVIRQELLTHPSITHVSGSDFIPLEKNNIHIISYTNDQDEIVELETFFSTVGYDFFNVFRIEMVEGRSFSPEYTTDIEEAVIVNELIVEMAGWEDPVGQIVDQRGRRVIGVVKDFHQSSLHEAIAPMIFFLNPQEKVFLSARILPGNIPATIRYMKNTVERYSTDFAFEFYFQDDYFNVKYQSDERFGNAFKYGSAIAIIVASMGIFGLVTFSSERRVKEIAVRKVLGASIRQIVFNLTHEFMVDVGVANLFAWPVAYYIMTRWLQNFAFRIDISIWIFLWSAIIALLIALTTVGYQAIKAAIANPVEALRYE